MARTAPAELDFTGWMLDFAICRFDSAEVIIAITIKRMGTAMRRRVSVPRPTARW